jgi:hypothetical protein
MIIWAIELNRMVRLGTYHIMVDAGLPPPPFAVSRKISEIR